jgi:hypothetical protein
MLPPSIPTSFVPHSASATARKFRSDLTGAFGFFAYAVLGLVLLLAIGVFLYGRLLASEQAAKDVALVKAQGAIDPATVESFVRLRDRLSSSKTLLGNHLAFSSFFNLISSVTPVTVRFTSLHILIDEKGRAVLTGAGVARSFNALAAASSAFAADGRVKDAVFSNIVVSPRDGSVSFALAATLDQKLVAFSVAESAPAPVPVMPQGSVLPSP